MAGSRSCAASPTPSAESTALEGQRRELEDFLERVTQQLAEFERWTHWRAGAAQSRRDDTLGLEKTMQAEIVHLNQEVGASTDCSYLKVRVQVRLGLTEFRAGDTPAAVYERADRALYQAKQQGRNRCVAE